jgi:FMN phosphatase YigB (HAD superfamily)
MKFYCDENRHLICVPYSVENLHKMAEELGIKYCWFHSGGRTGFHPHYDIPFKRIAEIKAKCEVVSTKEILKLIKNSSAEIPSKIP